MWGDDGAGGSTGETAEKDGVEEAAHCPETGAWQIGAEEAAETIY